MRTCMNCGVELKDGEKYCMNCGAQVPETAEMGTGSEAAAEPSAVGTGAVTDLVPASDGTAVPADVSAGPSGTPEEPKKKNGKKTALIAAAAAVVAAGAAVACFSLFNSPAKRFAEYQKALITDGLMKGVTAGIEQGNRSELSTDMLITAEVEGIDYIGGYLEDSSIALKMDSSANDSLMNLEVTLMGSPLIDGAITFDDGVFGICMPALKEEYYQVDMEEEMLALYRESYSDESMIAALILASADTEQLNALTAKYVDLLFTAVNRDNVSKSKADPFPMVCLDAASGGDLYVFDPTAADLEPMLVTLADTLAADQDLRTFLMDAILADPQFLNVFNDWGEPEEIKAVIDERITAFAGTMKESAAETAATLEEADVTWSLGLNGTAMALNRLAWKSGGTYAIGLECVDDTFAVYASQDDVYVLRADAEITNADGAYSGAVDLQFEDGTAMGVTFDDIQTEAKSILEIPYGTYCIASPDTGVEIEMEVAAAEAGGSDHWFRVQAEGQTIAMNFHTTDQPSTATAPEGTPVVLESWEEMAGILTDDYLNGMIGLLMQILLS